jgi:tetratricopeptide (TPR) repeat protein
MRKAISYSMIEYYEHELTDQISDQERQVTTIELLYHKLFLDLNVGVKYFEEQIQRAQRLWQLNFARLLLLEASKFRSTMSLAHQNTLQFYEARLLRLGESPASIEVIKDLERQADPQWMKQRKADFLLEVGRCYHARSLSKDAREYFTRALEAVQDNEELKAYILSYLGGVCRKQGQLVEAVRFFEQSTTIQKGLGNRIEYANSLSTTGSVLAQQGKYEEAMRRCKIALHIREEAFAHKEASEIHIGYGLTTLGVIYLDSGNILEAERCFKRAFDIYSRLDYKGGIAALYNHFGNVELHRGDQEKAQYWFLKGEQAAIDVNAEQYINSLNKLGRMCLIQERIQEAFSYLQRAIIRARQVPDNVQLTESLIDLAKVLDQMDQEEEAKTLLQEAEEIADREQYANSRAAIELIRAETALRQMHYHEVFRHLEQYCYHTLQHNTSEYSAAVRKTIDVLLTVPAAEQAAIIQELIDGWTSRGLADRYPELIEACKEFQEWSIG